jgi:hypothetical protein
MKEGEDAGEWLRGMKWVMRLRRLRKKNGMLSLFTLITHSIPLNHSPASSPSFIPHHFSSILLLLDEFQ